MAAVAASDDDSVPIQDVISFLILFADRVIKSAQGAHSFKHENSELTRHVTDLSHLLRSAARLASAAAYDRPIRRLSAQLTKTLDRALTLTRRCRYKRTDILHRILSLTTAADFKKVSILLDSSLADIKWVLSIFDPNSDNGTINLSLPPIASTDPILALVWPYIVAAHMGPAEATRDLAILAKDNDRTRRIMVEENGIPPLLKMLRETGNVDAQSAAAIALCNLTDDPMVVKTIVEGSGVKSIVEVLSEVPMKVQVPIVNLISRILEVDVDGQEEFGKENLAKPLVALLGVDIDLEEFKMIRSLYTLALINKEMMKKHVTNSVGGIHSSKGKEKDREESSKIRLALKVRCADALWKLAKGSSSNSKKITETKALLVLAKIIEIETSDLKLNCLKVIMELAAVAERDSGLKRSAFKPNSCTVKVVLDQLLRVINEERNEAMVTLAIKAVGCLASTFSAKEARIVKSLVMQLGCRNLDVASEASKSLCKFVRDDNYNRKEHSQAIIESNGVVKILNLMQSKDYGHLHELVLLCNLAMNAGDDKAFEQTQVLTVLERAAIRHTMTQNPALSELFAKAIHQLTIYQAADHTHRHV